MDGAIRVVTIFRCDDFKANSVSIYVQHKRVMVIQKRNQ